MISRLSTTPYLFIYSKAIRITATKQKLKHSRLSQKVVVASWRWCDCGSDAKNEETYQVWATFIVCITPSITTAFHFFVSSEGVYSPDSCCSSPRGWRRHWCSVPTADRDWDSSGHASWPAPLLDLPVTHTHTQFNLLLKIWKLLYNSVTTN